MKINKRLTKVNYQKGINKKNKYVVVHYVAAEGGAEDNCRYFEKLYWGSSAHYFIGHAGEIWQCVEDKDIAWHCGTKGTYRHKVCRNSNSIGVEMCCRKRNGKWYFEEPTILSTIGLIKELMAKYNIPVDNVIRHYDVSGKICPEPYVRNSSDWKMFKQQLTTAQSAVNKTVESVAKEVIKGLWGNQPEREKRLTAAGYDYKKVQAMVNKLLR